MYINYTWPGPGCRVQLALSSVIVQCTLLISALHGKLQTSIINWTAPHSLFACWSTAIWCCRKQPARKRFVLHRTCLLHNSVYSISLTTNSLDRLKWRAVTVERTSKSFSGNQTGSVWGQCLVASHLPVPSTLPSTQAYQPLPLLSCKLSI